MTKVLNDCHSSKCGCFSSQNSWPQGHGAEVQIAGKGDLGRMKTTFRTNEQDSRPVVLKQGKRDGAAVLILPGHEPVAAVSKGQLLKRNRFLDMHGDWSSALLAGFKNDPLPSFDLSFTMSPSFTVTGDKRDEGVNAELCRLLDQEVHFFALEYGLG